MGWGRLEWYWFWFWFVTTKTLLEVLTHGIGPWPEKKSQFVSGASLTSVAIQIGIFYCILIHFTCSYQDKHMLYNITLS